MINFANFKSNNQSNSNFIETVSLEEMKAACNGARIDVYPSKEKTHKVVLPCVSLLVVKLQAW